MISTANKTPSDSNKDWVQPGAPTTVEDLSVDVVVEGRIRPILRDVSFQISPGSTLGLVGESGSGKSMTARAIARLLPPGAAARGTVRVGDVDVLALKGAALRQYRARDVAMIFQDPRAHVNPVRTVGDYLTEGMRLTRGMSRRQAVKRALSILDDVGIAEGPRRLRQYPHEFSGGMLQRIMIAGALAADPALLLADEPTTALDATVQAEIMALLNELKVEHELAILLITHDLEMAAAVCERTAVMYAGRIVESRASQDFYGAAMHPYSSGLLEARPRLRGGDGPLRSIPGTPKASFEVTTECVFYDRCDRGTDECAGVDPPTLRPAIHDVVRCHHPITSNDRGQSPRTSHSTAVGIVDPDREAVRRREGDAATDSTTRP
jgi:oligopeptide/dipeptide ABC transporter ATP-binding protein